MARQIIRKNTVKQAQREAGLFREIANLFLRITMDEPSLIGLSVSRVKLSPDGGICTVFFFTGDGEAEFSKLLGTLILYKPSLRSALAKQLNGRYVPNLIFRFDTSVEKQERMNQLFEKLKASGDL